MYRLSYKFFFSLNVRLFPVLSFYFHFLMNKWHFNDLIHYFRHLLHNGRCWDINKSILDYQLFLNYWNLFDDLNLFNNFLLAYDRNYFLYYFWIGYYFLDYFFNGHNFLYVAYYFNWFFNYKVLNSLAFNILNHWDCFLYNFLYFNNLRYFLNYRYYFFHNLLHFYYFLNHSFNRNYLLLDQLFDNFSLNWNNFLWTRNLNSLNNLLR